MIRYLDRRAGFGMRPGIDTLSPFAEMTLGRRDDLRQRSHLSFRLVEKDLMKMGCNQTKLDFDADKDLRHARFLTFDAFRTEKRVNPIHLNDIFFMDFDFRASSPGIPWQPDYSTRGEVMDCPAARNSIRWFWHRIKAGEELALPDTKVLYRAHLVGEDGKHKIRAVYGYPTTVTLAEAQFAVPLTEEFKKQSTPIAFGYDMALGGARKLRNEISKYQKFLCCDFKNFDKTVSAQLIRMAFDVLLQNIDFRRYRDHGVPDASRLYRVWQALEDYFINTNVRMCDGRRYKKSAGVPSGSFFTQMVDSIVNYFVLTYACLKTKKRPPAFIKVFGDDSVIADDDIVHICDIAKVAYDMGMVVNIDKSLMTGNVDEVEFLGFKITNGFPQRGTKRWLEALYYPEHPDKEWDDFASRALGLFYANHGVNWEFDCICRFIIKKRSFMVRTSRDFRKFLRNIGVDVERMDIDLPGRASFLFGLIG